MRFAYSFAFFDATGAAGSAAAHATRSLSAFVSRSVEPTRLERRCPRIGDDRLGDHACLCDAPASPPIPERNGVRSPVFVMYTRSCAARRWLRIGPRAGGGAAAAAGGGEWPHE